MIYASVVNLRMNTSTVLAAIMSIFFKAHLVFVNNMSILECTYSGYCFISLALDIHIHFPTATKNPEKCYEQSSWLTFL